MQTKLRNCNFQNATLNRADLTGVDCWGSNFTDADMRFSTLSTGRFGSCNFTNTNFEGVTAINADFGGSDLCLARFVAADLRGSNFKGADLAGVDFSDCNLLGVILTGAFWDEQTVWPVGFNPSIDKDGNQ